MLAINEDMKIHEKFYEDAKMQNLETLPEFLKGLLDKYQHDYGTICHAISAGALATAYAMNEHPTNGGITGYQAGFVMWGFVTHFLDKKDNPLRLIDYADMLYPQYSDKFDKAITSEQQDWLIKKAKDLLKCKGESEFVRKHWQSIIDGNVPFGYRIKD